MKRAVTVSFILLTGCQWMPGSEAGRIKEAEEVVARKLRDPGSAQFRNVRVVNQVDGSKAFCGEVNGRNAYGGYVGFQPFVYGAGRVFIGDDDVDSIQARTNYCVREGRTSAEFEAHIADINANAERIRAQLKN